MLFNGLTIGAVAGHLTGIGYHQPFWSFVIGHGAFELTAITFAGAAGLQLGAALLAPGCRTRAQALRLAAKHGIQLVCGATACLLIAAFVEAYWSSMTLTTPTIKYIVGAALWLLVGAYFMFAGRVVMQLTEASVSIRPRSSWEALDLGIHLARRHTRLLMLSWAAVTLPVFGLFSLLLWQRERRTAAVLVAQAIVRAATAAHPVQSPVWRDALPARKPQGLSWPVAPAMAGQPTWRRLSTSSFDLPVQQLEGLDGRARKQRLVTLSLAHDARPAG